MEKRILAKETVDKIGEKITVSGWINSTRDHGGVVFIDLRDESGIVQITVNPELSGFAELSSKIKVESVIKVEGRVEKRDEKLINPNIETGTIEIKADKVIVLNPSEALPFQIELGEGVNEELRLKYRFLDLRRGKMQTMLKRRHEMLKMIRNYMDDNGFIEVTTPILTSSSPEGARDFLVPSRLHPGKFYALPQAPQIFKQLLMVSSVPRYYQIAPCFRDEDPRADRSPGEFYQLDLEIAFVEKSDEVFQIMEPLFVELTEKFAKKKVLTKPFPRIPYKEAMEKYGSDRPDLRYDMAMIDLSDELKNCGFSVLSKAIADGGIVRAIVAPSASHFSRSQIDELEEFAKSEKAGGLAYIVMEENGPKSPILKFFSPEEIAKIIEKTNAKNGDIIFFGADKAEIVQNVLGKLRDKIAGILNLKDPNVIGWAWITDFPMYEWNERDKKIDFMHNPFSMPQGGLDALNTMDPLEIKADQYDIIANGLELSSGAIRNYNPDIMYKAFEIAGIDKETVNTKFSSIINAFKFGAPPHGGFAPGIDRMMMLFENEPNIREVIAFPKNGSAEDLMMSAPSDVTDKQLQELHIKINITKK